MSVLLVIDDETSILHAFRRAFRESGLTVLTASTAAEGLELVAQQRPDVVLLDIHLPDQSGLKLFQRLQEIDGTVPTIFITASEASGQAIEARRIPVGNLIFRAVAAVAILVALQLIELPMGWFGASAARQVVNLHLAFNLALLVLFLPLTGPMERLVALILPDAPAGAESFDRMSRRVSALDRTVIKMPSVALASATREVLRMAEVVEIMLRPVMDLFDSGDRARVEQVRKLDEEVNRAHTDIKLYIAVYIWKTAKAHICDIRIIFDNAGCKLDSIYLISFFF